MGGKHLRYFSLALGGSEIIAWFMHNKILYFPKETDEAMTDGYTDTGPTDTSSDDDI